MGGQAGPKGHSLTLRKADLGVCVCARALRLTPFFSVCVMQRTGCLPTPLLSCTYITTHTHTPTGKGKKGQGFPFLQSERDWPQVDFLLSCWPRYSPYWQSSIGVLCQCKKAHGKARQARAGQGRALRAFVPYPPTPFFFSFFLYFHIYPISQSGTVRF